jgi:ABC-type phosphate transport system auxiliary subunit
MAKALFGHVVSGSDSRLACEISRLRARVSELQGELDILRAENTRLLSEVSVSEMAVEDDLRRLAELGQPAFSRV